MFLFEEDCFAAALREKPAAIALAWPRPEQDLKRYIDRAHDAGCKVTLMAGGVPEAERGVAAGADIIIAQGTEGGGHVGWMASIVLTPMVVDAVAPVPVLQPAVSPTAAVSRRRWRWGRKAFCSAPGSWPAGKPRCMRISSRPSSTATDTIPSLPRFPISPPASFGRERCRAPSAMPFIEHWAGREWALRQHRTQAYARVQAARQAGDVNNAPLSYGQDAGLINDVVPAGEIVQPDCARSAGDPSKRLPAFIR